MQSERVTFLTTPDHKAALDAFAASNGMSMGRVVREATSQFMTQTSDDEEVELAALVGELNEAVPRMRADIAEAVASIARANATVDAILSRDGRDA